MLLLTGLPHGHLNSNRRLLNMPIYEYKCKCKIEGEFILPFDAKPPICECGEVMQLKMSVPAPATFKPTGKGMALDSLNSNVVGGRRKVWAEQHAAAGLDRIRPLEEKVFTGF